MPNVDIVALKPHIRLKSVKGRKAASNGINFQ